MLSKRLCEQLCGAFSFSPYLGFFIKLNSRGVSGSHGISTAEHLTQREQILFEHVAAGARGASCPAQLVVVVVRDDHDSGFWKGCFNLACGRYAVHTWHPDVHQNPVWMTARRSEE